MEIDTVYLVKRGIANQLVQHVSITPILQFLEKRPSYFEGSETLPTIPKIQTLIDKIINGSSIGKPQKLANALSSVAQETTVQTVFYGEPSFEAEEQHQSPQEKRRYYWI